MSAGRKQIVAEVDQRLCRPLAGARVGGSLESPPRPSFGPSQVCRRLVDQLLVGLSEPDTRRSVPYSGLLARRITDC